MEAGVRLPLPAGGEISSVLAVENGCLGAFRNCGSMPIVRVVTSPYVPLRVFSSFTMLEGAMEPKTIAAQAEKLGFPAVALTDRNGLYGAMPFSDACIAKGVQPIIGAMLCVARPPEIGGAGGVDWLVLLAKDDAWLCEPVQARLLGAPRPAARAGAACRVRQPRAPQRRSYRAHRRVGRCACAASLGWPARQGGSLSRPAAGAVSRPPLYRDRPPQRSGRGSRRRGADRPRLRARLADRRHQPGGLSRPGVPRRA